MAARWQGVIALLLLIIISYVDRVNISVMILTRNSLPIFS